MTAAVDRQHCRADGNPKRRFESQACADNAVKAAAIRGRTQTAYRCTTCEGWHTATVKAGPILTGAQLQSQACDLAHLRGWRWHHARPMRDHEGTWRTPISGDPGWPDVAFCHPVRGVFLVVEFKGAREGFRPGQREWLDALRASGVDARVWRPTSWPEIEQTLGGVP